MLGDTWARRAGARPAARPNRRSPGGAHRPRGGRRRHHDRERDQHRKRRRMPEWSPYAHSDRRRGYGGAQGSDKPARHGAQSHRSGVGSHMPSIVRQRGVPPRGRTDEGNREHRMLNPPNRRSPNDAPARSARKRAHRANDRLRGDNPHPRTRSEARAHGRGIRGAGVRVRHVRPAHARCARTRGLGKLGARPRAKRGAPVPTIRSGQYPLPHAASRQVGSRGWRWTCVRSPAT